MRRHKQPTPQKRYHQQLCQATAKHLPRRGLPLTCDDQRIRWSDRMLCIAAVLMSWTKRPALIDAFFHVRNAVVGMYPSRKRPGQTAKGFFDALKRRGPQLAARLRSHLRRESIRAAGPRWRWQRWVPLAVDGCRIECPRTAANEKAFGCAGRTKTGPQQWLTTVYHVTTGLLWDYRRDVATAAERTHLRAMIAGLPCKSLLLMDAGFVGFDLLRQIAAAGHDFIVRAGGNVTLLEELDCDGRIDGSTVWLWPQWRQGDCEPLRLRRVTFVRKGRTICLLTSVTNKRMLPDAAVKKWYRQRWEVEVQYRNLKQTMQHRRLLSQTPQTARAELDWAVLGLWLLQLMLVTNQPQRKRYSIAAGLRILRRAMHDTGRVPAGGLRKQLRYATRDEYVRRRPKQARDWPHKKKDPPCCPPKFRTATDCERQQAQAFRAPEQPN